jgi:hypothetical protein
MDEATHRLGADQSQQPNQQQNQKDSPEHRVLSVELSNFFRAPS